MKFFFDNNLSPKLARSLDALAEPEHRVTHLRQRFPGNTSDVEWMSALAAEEDWIIVSGDLRIRNNPHEVAAWKKAGHTTFFLKQGWLDLGPWDQMWKLAKAFPELVDTASRAPRGSPFFVTVNGKIESA